VLESGVAIQTTLCLEAVPRMILIALRGVLASCATNAINSSFAAPFSCGERSAITSRCESACTIARRRLPGRTSISRVKADAVVRIHDGKATCEGAAGFS
jgi:hypothetical protein